MRVLCVAHDVAPSHVFAQKIVPELQACGHEVMYFLAKGKARVSPLDQILSHVATSDIVLLGMSSSKQLAEEELAAGELAVKLGVPVALFSDTYIPHREHFSELEKAAACAFFVDADTAAGVAEKYGVQTERIASGNPVWEDFHFPKVERAAIRSEFGVADNDTLILVPGGKEMPINMALLTGVVNACMMPSMQQYSAVVAFAVHPGEFKTEDEERAGIGAYRCFEKVPYITPKVKIIPRGARSTSELTVGADMVVESMSTAGIEAAHLRIPVIEYFTEMALIRLEKMAGSRTWDPYDIDVVDGVSANADALSAKMGYLLTPSGFSVMRAVQERRYPKPTTRGTAVRTIVDALERHARMPVAR